MVGHEHAPTMVGDRKLNAVGQGAMQSCVVSVLRNAALFSSLPSSAPQSKSFARGGAAVDEHAAHVSKEFDELAKLVGRNAGRVRAHVNSAHALAIVRSSPTHGAVGAHSRRRPYPLQLRSGFH